MDDLNPNELEAFCSAHVFVPAEYQLQLMLIMPVLVEGRVCQNNGLAFHLRHYSVMGLDGYECYWCSGM